MVFGSDTGNIFNPKADWGRMIPFSTRNLRMPIPRTADRVVPEFGPMIVKNRGKLGVTPNGQVFTLGAASDDALDALDKLGARGAAVLGGGVGLVLSTNRLLGAAVGAGLGFVAGKYLASVIKATLAAQKLVSTASKVG